LQRAGLFVPRASGYAGFTRLNRSLWGIAIEHTGMHMSLEVLEQLESKVQSAVEPACFGRTEYQSASSCLTVFSMPSAASTMFCASM